MLISGEGFKGGYEIGVTIDGVLAGEPDELSSWGFMADSPFWLFSLVDPPSQRIS